MNKKQGKVKDKTREIAKAADTHLSRLTEFDISLFKSGKHFKLYEKLGSHIMTSNGIEGVYFGVWAPSAVQVSVIGDFNEWDSDTHKMYPRWDGSGVWELFIPRVKKGAIYKYYIRSEHGGRILEKADPFAFYCEVPPGTASVVWDLNHTWEDEEWMSDRGKRNSLSSPKSVYELHLASWCRKAEADNRSFTYLELADDLVRYVKEMGYTHVELMPVMEHPFGGSWGYQITGYFAPTSRFGTPQEFMQLIEEFHKNDIGVILDWVPSHFPGDAHGLAEFDGTHLYEHADPKKGFHPDWNSFIFNYGRLEVRSFLISNALFWLDHYHIDGLRVDAVASMLYLDYSRKDGEWIPNKYGGNENLEAISLLKEFNETVYNLFPDVQTIAEESTAWPMVSKPTYLGGLGFGLKWMMGWMHDTLDYFSKDPLYRPYHQGQITFSLMYAFNENFMLPLSHDEVVHGKGSLLEKMPGDDWQKFANLRLLFGYMFTHPGAKLNFMGGELGQRAEWNHDSTLEWSLLEYPSHKGINDLVKDLNFLFRKEKALYELNFSQEGFQWIDYHDSENCVISYTRKGREDKDQVIVICNFTPVVRENYRIGVPFHGPYSEILNSDHEKYWGSGTVNENIEAMESPSHEQPYSIRLKLPPLAIIVLKPEFGN